MRSHVPVNAVRRHKLALLLPLVVLAANFAPGCGRGPQMLAPELRKPIDRSLVERPASLDIERFITNLTAPTAIAFDFDPKRNAMLVAESGIGRDEPRILGFNFGDGSTFVVYPRGKQFFGLRSNPFRMFGPIGGMAVKDGVVYVSHRDENGFGVISAVTYDGKGSTVIAGLPAQGDYGVTDVVFGPDGRLYFGVGSATNSGVVGLDNFEVGWVRKHPKLADKFPKRPNNEPWRLRGTKFFTPNPFSGLFTGADLAITAPFQPFGEFTRSRIPGDDKPNSAVYSIKPAGGIAGDMRIEASGIRLPAGLAFNSRDTLFATNQGMEARGTRPVLNDPCSVLRIYRGRHYAFPDYSTNLLPITDPQFQPPEERIRRTGFTELVPLFDFPSDLGIPFDPTDRENMVRGVLPPLSGAAKMTFVPDDAGDALARLRGHLIVALSGDRSPFATENAGRKLLEPVGYKLVDIEIDGPNDRNVSDFIRNTEKLPRSMTKGRNSSLLERPIDAKFGPDGDLYVLDFGQLEVRNGKERVKAGTGQVFRVHQAGSAAPKANSATTSSAPASEESNK
jgi:glucose/arabinose dehydrogenase